MKRKFLKRLRITLFNLTMLGMLIASGTLLAHDIFIWAIKPLFTHEYYLLTYFGFYCDMFALACFILAKDYFKEFFKKF